MLWVPNDAIPYITAGDKVNVRYDAFPAEKFGQFAGTVSVISKAPASPQEMRTYQGPKSGTDRRRAVLQGDCHAGETGHCLRR